jgi:hypothetical protein
MSNTPETDAFIDSLHDDWDVEFANLTAHACKLELERNQWRECAEKLVEAFRGVPYDPYTVGSFNSQNCKNALTDFRRLKEETK